MECSSFFSQESHSSPNSDDYEKQACYFSETELADAVLLLKMPVAWLLCGSTTFKARQTVKYTDYIYTGEPFYLPKDL